MTSAEGAHAGEPANAARERAAGPLVILAIETSGRAGSVALARAEAGAPLHVLSERAIDPAVRHGQALLPAVEGALADAGIDKRALGLIACGTGPGSYTSLRVGLAFGRTLGYALGVELAGVPSVDALARGLGEEPLLAQALGDAQSVVIALDAFRGEVYAARFRVDAAGLTRDGAIEVGPAAAAIGDLARPVVVLGDATARYPDAFAQQPDVRVADLAHAVPQARHVAALAAEAYFAGRHQAPRDVLPLYLRAALPTP